MIDEDAPEFADVHVRVCITSLRSCRSRKADVGRPSEVKCARSPLLPEKAVDTKGKDMLTGSSAMAAVTDPEGFFHIAAEGLLPDEVTLRVYQVYRSKYAPFEAYLPFDEKVAPSQIGRKSIIMKRVSGDQSVPMVRF